MRWLFEKILWLIRALVGVLFDILDWIVGGLPDWTFGEGGGAFETAVNVFRGIDRFFPVGTLASAIGIYLGFWVLVRTWRPFLRLVLGARSPV